MEFQDVGCCGVVRSSSSIDVNPPYDDKIALGVDGFSAGGEVPLAGQEPSTQPLALSQGSTVQPDFSAQGFFASDAFTAQAIDPTLDTAFAQEKSDVGAVPSYGPFV